MRKFQRFTCKIRNKENQESLQDQRHGDHQDVQRILQNDLSLEREQQDQHQQQSCSSRAIKFRKKILLEISDTFFLRDENPGQNAPDQRNHYKQNDGQDQGVPWDRNIADAQQKFNDRNESNQDDQIIGGNLEHRGVLGTGIFRVFNLHVAQTGMTEREAKAAGYAVEVLYNIKPDHAEYLGGKELVIKALADKATGRVLGAQIVGFQGVDKRIDVLATAITFNAKAEDLFHLDLAYAPPFATTKDPVLYTGMALDNALHGNPLMTPTQLVETQQKGESIQVIDTRSAKDFEKSHVQDAIHVPLGELRARAGELSKDIPTVTYCNKGVTGNAAQNILINMGFQEVYNLSGGNKNYQSYLKMLKRKR